LAHIHGHGVVFRDLKPENILLETNDSDTFKIKIIDFGTSNYFNKNSKLTLKVGTPYYIAPEVLKMNYDNKCDIWSCGVIMYFLLSGAPPFNGPDDNAITEQVLIGKYSIIGKEWVNVNNDAKDLISKMLAFNPYERISADACLEHPWIIKNIGLNSQKYNQQQILTEFKKPRDDNFLRKNILKKAIIEFLESYVSSQIMANDLTKIF